MQYVLTETFVCSKQKKKVPVSACGISFHDIIQNMTVAAQVLWSFSAIAGSLTQCVWRMWSRDQSIGHFTAIFLADVPYGVFFFFLLFFVLELRRFPGILRNWVIDFMKLQPFSWIYRPLTGPVGSERPSRQKWSPRERWWRRQRWGAWAARFSRTAGRCNVLAFLL